MNMTTPPATLPLARLSADYNPRRYFDRARHDELVASMRLRGMLQPILARPGAEPGDNYRIVAGGRRYRAALEAFGADGEVPVIIREMTDQEALEAAIDENDVRDDASETEQADAAVRVLAACRNDRAEAARRLGWSPSKLDRRLALAGLSETVKTALDERRIKVGHAELLAAVPTDKQDKALETVLKAGLDVQDPRTPDARHAGSWSRRLRQDRLRDLSVQLGHAARAVRHPCRRGPLHQSRMLPAQDRGRPSGPGGRGRT
jgi:PRTRC genetic system ParB family protein